MPSTDSKREKAREVVDILEEISMLLNTQLDRTQLSLCVSLIENGVNPEALAVGHSWKIEGQDADLTKRLRSKNYDEKRKTYSTKMLLYPSDPVIRRQSVLLHANMMCEFD
ncbi:mitotic-spindle organizing gamma-tubulin ring associated-domain-containing protein [Exophiala viscosa]|uniref:mitotic-spindle organizing gamma-tubulin ring associated-domain-containing protein n=1 Tax=Exophiala viscosa TaxID=2486360 RepID=UPI00219A1E26|nr:mitotic-spindle organizing gamma-tubulin ring associated-domain-containing protein [Exophiala viscosa]